MEYLPNTQINMPPPHHRKAWEIALLLFVGVAIPMAMLWLLVQAVRIDSGIETVPDAPEAHTIAPGAASSPVVVNVSVLMPTATPEPTSASSAVNLTTPLPDFCEPGITKQGEVCQKPDPPPPTPTPYPSCNDITVDPGDRCRWQPTPIVEGLWK